MQAPQIPKEIEELIDGYIAKNHIPDFVNCKHASNRYLDLPTSKLRDMTADECGEASYVLSNYSMYLQKEINKYTSIQRYCDVKIDFIISREIDNVGGQYSKYEQKRILCIRQNDVASQLFKLRNNIEMYLTNLYDLPRKVENMSRTLVELQQSKRRKYSGN
jgi:hypothetical protein